MQIQNNNIQIIMRIRKIGLILMMLMAVSCTNKHKGGQPGDGQVKEYPVMAVTLQSTQLFKDYTTSLKGQQTVEIRSKIAGYIEQILVDEGAHVRKGQLLFRLNDNDLRASVRSAEAQVKVAEADIYSAQINLEKTKPLVEKNIVSKFDLASAESNLKAKNAQLAQAKANLENARASLQYSRITSPADGIIGTFPYRVGSLVSSTSTDPLTTVSNTAKMFAYFSMNEKEFMSFTKGLKGKTLQEKLAKFFEVKLILPDNSEFEKSGRLETASGLVDQSTGTVNIRASFPNPDGTLRSGGSGSVRIPQHLDGVIIIPQKAAFELQGKSFVYVVGADNKVHDTEIQVIVGNLKDTYVVTGGLNVGDKIVVDGISSLRTDTQIKPKLVDAGSLSENSSSVKN